jgi:xylulokinase
VVSVSLGTSGVVFSSAPSPKPDPSGAAHVFCHANRSWHAMGVMLSCGGAVTWFRNTFYPGRTYDEMAAEAAKSPVGANGLTFLPYLTGERCPYPDPMARGAFLGLDHSHSLADMARAMFEGVTFGLLDCKARLDLLGATSDELRLTGGGARGDFWVQMEADAFGKPCHRLAVDEGPAYGAALLAGVGAGVWPDVEQACRSVVRIKQTIEPRGIDYSKPYARYRAGYPAMRGWE